ncbi:MAG: winged helix-turn-helix transcriptional regulator, partial [Candidatus Fibromonas sp.]|nr:winged helix-turn-helix transcriptional regulator [Candidatus Fibromonas sp.]
MEGKIIEILKLNGSISRYGIAKKLGISNDLAKYYIDKLKKN